MSESAGDPSKVTQLVAWNAFFSFLHFSSLKAQVDNLVIRSLVGKLMIAVMFMNIHFKVVYNDKFLEAI